MINTTENTAEINKHKLIAMLHVFAQQVDKCKSAHDVTVMTQRIEADIDKLFSDVEVNQDYLSQQLICLHTSVKILIYWDAPDSIRETQIQAAKRSIKKTLFNKAFN